MERLVDSNGVPTAAEAELAGLVSACEPVRISEARKQRSLGNIYARHHERRRTARFAMRLAMATGVLLAAGAATAAVFGVRFRSEAALREPTALPADSVPHHAVHLPRPATPLTEPAPPPPMAELAPPPPAVHRTRLVRSEDPSLVVEAIQALRQDHDPVRAARLLASYLRTHPHGALAEEAAALSIEAADARHSPAATALAERYLREYPHGRFRPTAERVLARPAL